MRRFEGSALPISERATMTMPSGVLPAGAQSEALRTVLAALPTPVIVFDTRWRILLANLPAERLLGFRENELTELELDQLIPEQLRERYRLLRTRSKPSRDGLLLRGERIIRNKAGRELPVEIAVSRARIDGNELNLAWFHDISVYKRAEQETLERLHSIFENAEDGIFLIEVAEDGAFLFETFNPITERLTGLSRETARGRRPEQIVPESEAARVTERYRSCVELGKPVTYEEAPGEIVGHRVFRTTLVPIRDASGRVHRLLGVSRDITVQKRAESALEETRQSLKESEDRFSTAFRVSPHPIGITDLASGKLIEVNEAFERVFKHTREQSIGKTILELGLWRQPSDRERVRELIRAHGAFENLEIQSQDRNGRELELSLSGACIDIGGVPHLVTYVRDMTDRRAAERTSAELERQLRQAQKMDALGTLAGGIAHDFNNILGAMLAYTELIRLDIKSPPDLASHVDELRRAGMRAKDLVRRILTFSRREPRARRPVRVDQAVRDALDLLRATLPATIGIDASIAPLTPIVLADVTEIHQVIMNLGTNAAHAMEGAGRIAVFLETVSVDEALTKSVPELQPRRYLRVSVTDTGSGMTPDVLNHIFEPFFTTKAPGEGTGLGLPVVHGIIREHEGAIRVESEPGRGTKFEIYLPEHAVELPEEPLANELFVRGNGETVLLVDDEGAICRSVASLLERVGYSVTALSDPLAALERFREKPAAFDVLLTDLTMPEMTGVDLACKMLELKPELPVLVMSGFSASFSAEGLRALGILDLIPKPLSGTDLTRALARAVEQKR